MPIHYNENGSIKKPNIIQNFTKEEIYEYVKCIRDIVYFAETYCYIINPKYGKQKIKLYDHQKEILNNYQNNKLNIIQKSRQTGITTINNIFALHYALFNEYKTLALLSYNQRSAQLTLQDFKFMYENLPAFIKPGVVEYNTFNIKFDNKCQIITRQISCCCLCGLELDMLILDEFAFVPANIAHEFWNSNFPGMAVGKGKTIVVSTRFGENRKTNKFWELWCNAIEGSRDYLGNQFKPYYIDWNMLRERGQNWKNEIVKTIGIEKFINEYEISYTHPNPVSHDEDGNKRYSPKEFAKLFNVSTSTVARWRTKGKIKGIQLSDRQFYYTEDDIRRIKDKDLIYRIEKTPERNIFKIDCGYLPPDIVQKYVNELRERFKNQ